MIRRVLASVSVAALLCFFPASADADHYWSGMHWQRGGTSDTFAGALTIGGARYVPVHNGMSREPWLQDRITQAVARWNDPNWYPVHLVPSNLDPSYYPYPCDWTPPPDGWGISLCYGYPTDGAQAQAEARAVGGHLQWVRIIVHPSVHPDRMATVLTHELGHALGLAHRLDGGCHTVMAANSGCGWPDGHDREILARLYGSHSH